MQKLFISYNGNPLLEQLTNRFQEVCQVKDTIDILLADLKIQRDGRIGSDFSRDLDNKLTCECQRAYEVAAIRLELAQNKLMDHLRSLHLVCEKLKTALLDRDTNGMIDFGLEEAIAKNNLVCAVDVANQACALYHEVMNKQLRPFRCHYFAIERTFKTADERTDPREYVVLYSAQGSKMRFEGGNGRVVPKGPYLTLSEAKAEALYWVSYADTVGGDAQLFNVRTKLYINP